MIVRFHLIIYLTASLLVQAGELPSELKSRIVQKIYHGEFVSAKQVLDSCIDVNDLTLADQAWLYKQRGDIEKLSGNIDAAYKFWEKGNQFRSRAHPPGDYHLAWNYACLTNYYYEKINYYYIKPYADTCVSLIQNLNLEQQKEIEIYQIWNILAQSYKCGLTPRDNLSYFLYCYKNVVMNYYQQSLQFIRDNKIDSYWQAKTFHLIANAYLDQMWRGIMESSDSSDLHNMKMYRLADEMYKKAESCWIKLYGNHHFELAKTYSIHALLNYAAFFDDVSTEKKGCELSELALDAWLIDLDHPDREILRQIPNKADALFALKYYTGMLVRDHTRCNVEYAEKINRVAIMLWEIVYHEFDSENTNMMLSTYGTIPYIETMELQSVRNTQKLPLSVDTVVIAVQHIKYFDLFTQLKNVTNLKLLSIQELQQYLAPGEIFVDLWSDRLGSTFLTIISKTEAESHILPIVLMTHIDSCYNGIVNLNYHQFVTASRQMAEIVKPYFLSKQFSRLIICPNYMIRPIPAEVLLMSDEGIETGDYRNLNYLLRHIEIEYVLSPIFVKSSGIPDDETTISVFVPGDCDQTFTDLPFNDTLATTLRNKYKANLFSGDQVNALTMEHDSSSILHISGHATISHELKTPSGISFCGELYTHNQVSVMKKAPRLAVLNLCNSGIGKQSHGEGVAGFVRALHESGTENVLANVWEVDDKQSAAILTNFYQNLFNGNTTSAALQTAKLNHIDHAPTSELAAPFYWAGHQLTGRGIKFKSPEPKTYNQRELIYFLITSFGLIGAFFFWNFYLRNRSASEEHSE